MSKPFILDLPAVTNIAASKTATIEIPVGLRLHSLILQHGYAAGANTIAGAMTNLSELRFKVNDRVQRIVSGTQLRDLNLFHGTQFDCVGVPNTAPGVGVAMNFGEPWRKDKNDALSLALPTAWQGGQFRTVKLEVDLGSASTPTLTALGVFDDVVPTLKPGQDSPWFTKWLRPNFVVASTKTQITTIEKKDFLQQISLYPDSGASQLATKLALQKNGQILQQFLSAQDLKTFLQANEMYPAASGRSANISDIVLDYNDLLSGAENLADARELTLTVEAASAMSGTITGIIQRLGPLD